MIALFSLEFWIATLFIINFILVVFLFLFVKKINRMNLREPYQKGYEERQKQNDPASESAAGIVKLLEPLVQEARKAAVSFDEQIKEKKRLLKGLNDALDSRIISINLLLSRADALRNKLEERPIQAGRAFEVKNSPDFKSSSVEDHDQQNQIIEMYYQNFDMDTIARRLSIPRGEVQLVLDLKKKFIAMEKKCR